MSDGNSVGDLAPLAVNLFMFGFLLLYWHFFRWWTGKARFWRQQYRPGAFPQMQSVGFMPLPAGILFLAVGILTLAPLFAPSIEVAIQYVFIAVAVPPLLLMLAL